MNAPAAGPPAYPFVLATFELQPGWAADLQAIGAPLAALARPTQSQFLVVHLVWDGVPPPDHSAAVYLSLAAGDPRKPPQQLACWLAYSNRVAWCDDARRLGMPMIEAAIGLVDDGQLSTLQIDAPRYGPPDPSRGGGCSVLAIGQLLVARVPNALLAATGQPSTALSLVYNKNLVVPDAADPSGTVQIVSDPWTAAFDVMSVGDGGAGLALQPARYPDLERLLGAQSDCVKVWSGTMPQAVPATAAPAPSPSPIGSKTSAPPPAPLPRRCRTPRAALFGPPDFVFDDVEIIGFRVDLSGSKAAPRVLNELVDHLNFHQRVVGSPATDFSYRIATPSVVIELLRYGQMRLKAGWPPVLSSDFQPQHELLVRLLVGRVDEDTTQGRDAAIYVPAIFVDNPWSKALGREVQGFPKVLATFCASDARGRRVPLGMDGRPAPGTPIVPLMDVDFVGLVDRVGGGCDPAAGLLQIAYSDDVDRSSRNFEAADFSAISGSALLASGPWRQSDFSDVDFRRSFARPVLRRGFTGFRSIQVAPVDAPGLPADCAWIEGTFTMKNLKYRFPSGIASLYLPDNAGAPDAWRALRALLGDGRVSLATGDWYRAQCSMGMSLDDGLDW